MGCLTYDYITMELLNLKFPKEGVIECVGNTPLVRLGRMFTESTVQLYGKLEMFNPGGSIKDRTALNIMKRALEEGLIDSETTIVESSSGNMGIGLARTCHYLGLKLILVTDPHINPLAEKILKTFGAKVIKVTQDDGNGGYLNTRLTTVNTLLQQIPNSFWPDQYHNMDNPLAHEQTFLEVMDALKRPVDYFFISTSTCGTLRGFADAIKKYQVETKIVAVDAVGSVIFGNTPQPRLIPGMGASRKSNFLKPEQVHEVVHISDSECIDGCRQLLARESILAGGSSGAIVKAVEKKLSGIPHGAVVVALIADNGERYLDTIYSDEWVLAHL